MFTDIFRHGRQPASLSRFGQPGGMSLMNYRALDWEWLSLDGCMTEAPLAGEVGRSESHGPGGKMGTKRSVLVEGHGLPIAVVVAGANVQDRPSLGENSR